MPTGAAHRFGCGSGGFQLAGPAKPEEGPSQNVPWMALGGGSGRRRGGLVGARCFGNQATDQSRLLRVPPKAPATAGSSAFVKDVKHGLGP